MYCKSPFLLVLLLWATGLGAAAQFAKFALFIPELERLYPHSGAWLGLLVSSTSVMGALFGLFAGALAARYPLKQLLLWGLILGAAVSFMQSVLPPLMPMLASRVLEGISHLAIVVTAPTLIALASSDRRRSAAMTLWGSFFGVSFAVTAGFGIPIVANHGVDSLFMAHGVFMTVMAALIAVLIPAGEVEHRESHDRESLFSASVFAKRHLHAWGSAHIAAPAAGWLFYTLTFVALLAILPGMMNPDLRATTAFLLPLISVLASMTLGVILLSWLSAVHLIILGLILAIGSALIFLLEPRAYVSSLALFAALGLVQGATFASIPQLNPERDTQSLANGTLAQAGNIGNLVGTPLLLSVMNTFGFNAMIAIAIACYLAAIIVHVCLGVRRRRHETR